MQQRGNDRVNVHRDDEIKHELQGMLRAERHTRAQEWRGSEPSSGDDPRVTAGPVPPRGAGDVAEAADEEFRFELARHLRRTVFPAGRRELLRTLFEEKAPDWLAETVRELPQEGSYGTVQEVAEALGRGPRR